MKCLMLVEDFQETANDLLELIRKRTGGGSEKEQVGDIRALSLIFFLIWVTIMLKKGRKRKVEA